MCNYQVYFYVDVNCGDRNTMVTESIENQCISHLLSLWIWVKSYYNTIIIVMLKRKPLTCLILFVLGTTQSDCKFRYLNISMREFSECTLFICHLPFDMTISFKKVLLHGIDNKSYPYEAEKKIHHNPHIYTQSTSC